MFIKSIFSNKLAKKLIFAAIVTGISSYGYCRQYFNVNIHNQSLTSIYAYASDWNDFDYSGAIGNYTSTKPQVIKSGDYFNFKPDTTTFGPTVILSFYVGIPQVNKNYTSEIPFILSDEEHWVGIYALPRRDSTEKQFTAGFRYTGEHQIEITPTMSSRISMVTTTNVGGDDRRVNNERWYSNAVGTVTTTSDPDPVHNKSRSTKRVYSDIHGKLESGVLYNYFKLLPPSNLITFSESTQDVLAITRGHLHADIAIGARVIAKFEPIDPNSSAQCNNSVHQLDIKDIRITPIKKIAQGNVSLESISSKSRVNGAIPLRSSADFPTLNEVIIQDFAKHIMSSPGKYTLWVGNIQNTFVYDFMSNNTLVAHKTNSGDVYSPMTLDDFDLNPDKVEYVLSTNGTDTFLENQDLQDVKIIGNYNVECKIDSPFNTNCVTAAYSTTASNTVTHTLTSGWKVSDKITIPLKNELTFEYNGSVADGTADTYSTTITIPSQTIPIPPGCSVQTSLEISSGTLDTDYTMYTKLKNNMEFTIRKPWKYMPQPKSNKEAGDVVTSTPAIGGAMIKPWGKSILEKLRSLSSSKGIVK